MAFAYQAPSQEWGPMPADTEQDPRWSPDWRKPNPGMLLNLIEAYDIPAAKALLVGDPDEDALKTQGQKTVKTLEAALRAFDDLQCMKARTEHSGATKWLADDVLVTIKDMGVIAACKGLLKIAKSWR